MGRHGFPALKPWFRPLAVAVAAVLISGCCGRWALTTTPAGTATPAALASTTPASQAPVPTGTAGPAPTATTGSLTSSPPGSPGTGTVTIGTPVQLEGGTATPGQEATITQASPDPLVDGLEISVPAGAYASNTVFTVTAAPITASTFGPLVKPVSDLITIDTGGAVAAVPVAVRIPAAIPADAVAGAWFYDANTGTLEGVPLVARDNKSMTVLTRHFSSIFISIAEAGLPDVIDSGFVPSLDAWQIPNYGAYPESRGYCSGSALTAMWYFLEQRRGVGASHLFGLYDNNGGTSTPGLWEDDANAIRLATTIQHKTDWNSLAARFYWKQEWIAGSLAYNAFRYTMAVTGEPQLVFADSAAGWHAMVVYRVDADRLWISDPNFPGEARSTIYDRATETIAPYVGSSVYTKILYAGKSAIAPWSDLAASWGAFTDGTIGDDVFPEVAFSILTPATGRMDDLTSGYETDQSTIKIGGGANVPQSWTTLYKGTTVIGGDAMGSWITVPLAQGDNAIGIYATAKVGGEDKWLQFKRFTIVRVAPSPSPDLGGTWRMVSGPDQIQETAPLSEIGWTTDGGPGSIQSTVSSTKEDFTVNFTWSAPSELVPGNLLDVGATIGVIKQPYDCEKDYDSVCDLAAELYAGLLVMTPPPDPQQGPQVITSANARGQRWQTTTPETVPDYDPMYGPSMVLQVGIQHSDASIWWQYVYEWSGAR
jgi:hypothetical protein